MAAIAGIDPWPWTLRELVAATTAKTKFETDLAVLSKVSSALQLFGKRQ